MAIIKCPECGHQISEKATNCPSCGVEIAGKIVRCDHCGEVYFNDEILCPNCHAPQPTQEAAADVAEEREARSRKHEHNHEEHPSKEQTTTAEEDVKSPQEQEKQTAGEQEKKTAKEQDKKTPEKREKKPAKKQDKKPAKEQKNRPADDVAEEQRTEDKAHEGGGSEKPKSRIMPFFVSLAIASIVGAVSIYFYKESKGSKEKQAFGLVLDSNDTLALNNFLASYSDAPSAHLDSIRSRRDMIRQGEADWDSLQQHKTHEAVAAYVSRYTNMPHYAQAVLLLDSIDWAEALATNTTTSYQEYLSAHQDGRHIAEAREKMYAGNLDVVASEERQMVTALMQRLFQSINDNDAGTFKSCLSPAIVSFMGTTNPSADEAAGWMRRQHGESVKSLSWSASSDYEIVKHKKENGSFEYTVKFSAKQDMVKSGKSSSDKYKVSSTITPDGKMTSLSMIKIVPQEEGASNAPKPSGTSGGSSSSSSSSSTSKPKTSTSSSSSSSTSKPKTSTSSSSSSSSTSKPKTSTSSSSSSSSTSKPKTSTSSSSSSTSKPKTSTSSSGSSTSKPKTSTSSSGSSSKAKTSTSSSGSSTSKPKTSTSSSGSSTSKPKTSTSSSGSSSKAKTSSSQKK